ncbi:MAG: GNAT family N-acetyltransferase [Anaerolineales bacterium]|nr:GNAT family N-acetyltransferase [Anaerolineales bacterium]
MEPRLYRNDQDLQRMRALLQAGCQAQNGTHYVHVGDLNWWLFYPPMAYHYWDHIYLWEDPDHPNAILAWALLSPVGETFDVVIRPELRGTPVAESMLAWADTRLTSIARSLGRDQIGVMWIAEHDQVLDGRLRERGFRIKNVDVYMLCPLEGALPAPNLPEGYCVRSSSGIAEVEARAAAQYGAFGSSAPFDRYVARFERFMQSPVYAPDLDVVAAAPDGSIGAFSIIWIDPVNRLGSFEPVGTHPDFRRKGLGKAVMLEGLRRLQAQGMAQVAVCTSQDNMPAIKLYESLGFRVEKRLYYYGKQID